MDFKDLHTGRYARCKTCISSSHSPWQISLRASRLQPKDSGKQCLHAGLPGVCVRHGYRVYSRSEHSVRLKDSRLLGRVDRGTRTGPIRCVHRCERRPMNIMSRVVIDRRGPRHMYHVKQNDEEGVVFTALLPAFSTCREAFRIIFLFLLNSF